jgi:hypothetical protein
MTQGYSDPSRESDPYALPDVEVFRVSDDYKFFDEEGLPLPDGWYWWTCFPGCLPDGDPNGPFDTEDEALADAQEVSS